MSGANNAPGDAHTDHEGDGPTDDGNAASAGAESPAEGDQAVAAAEDAVVDE